MRIKERQSLGWCSEFLTGTLDEITARLKTYTDGIDNPRFETEWIQDSESDLILIWDRPETDKEKAKRLRKATAAKEAKKKEAEWKHEQELKEFERLKKKFAPK